MTESTTPNRLADAVRLHQGGRLADAAALYQQILDDDPLHADALHLLGIARAQQGGTTRMVVVPIAQAAALNPASAVYRGNLAKAIRGDWPAVATALRDAGDALYDLGQRPPAARCYRAAVMIQPDDGMAWFNFGLCRRESGVPADAMAPIARTARLWPEQPRIAMELGGLRLALKDPGGAADVFRSVLRQDPGNGAAHVALANALKTAGHFPAAMESYRMALALEPADANALFNLGVTAADSGRHTAAETSLRHAIALAPGHVGAHFNLSCQLLMTGHWAEGWRLHEWRLRQGTPLPGWDKPRWNGEAPEGRTILVYCEQGHGDAIQFIRFAPRLAARGARVVVECQPALVGLFRSMAGVVAVHPLGEAAGFDLVCPSMSLPHVLGVERDDLPAEVPYLRADPARAAYWRDRLGAGEPKVGLIWAGNPSYRGDHARSPRLAGIRPILDMSGLDTSGLEMPALRFFGLQQGDGWRDLVDAASTAPLPASFTDLGPEVGDFAETAAIMMAMDLIVTSDTGQAHLAGALGRTVWVLLPFVADWRWEVEGEQTPWYPNLRLFRQERPGDWAGVAARVADALRQRYETLTHAAGGPRPAFEGTLDGSPSKAIGITPR